MDKTRRAAQGPSPELLDPPGRGTAKTLTAACQPRPLRRRQYDVDGGAVAALAFDLQRAVVLLDQAAADGEAETGAALRARLVGIVLARIGGERRRERAGALQLGHAETGILDLDPDPFGLPHGAQ